MMIWTWQQLSGLAIVNLFAGLCFGYLLGAINGDKVLQGKRN